MDDANKSPKQQMRDADARYMAMLIRQSRGRCVVCNHAKPYRFATCPLCFPH